MALATPVTFLEVSDGSSICGGPLADGERFRYTYTQSIYEVPVEEELERQGQGLTVRQVRSPDIRAVEYFRWDVRMRVDERGFVQDAPRNEVARLLIRISPGYDQRIATERWSCDLVARFGDAVVTVRAISRPWALGSR